MAFYIYRSIVFVVSFSSSPFRFLLPLLIPTHPAVAAQLVAVVDALLLGQREVLPPLVEVAQARVDLAIVHPTCSREKKGGAGSACRVDPEACRSGTALVPLAHSAIRLHFITLLMQHGTISQRSSNPACLPLGKTLSRGSKARTNPTPLCLNI